MSWRKMRLISKDILKMNSYSIYDDMRVFRKYFLSQNSIFNVEEFFDCNYYIFFSGKV